MQSVLPEDKEGRDKMGIMIRGLERHCHNIHTRPYNIPIEGNYEDISQEEVKETFLKYGK